MAVMVTTPTETKQYLRKAARSCAENARRLEEEARGLRQVVKNLRARIEAAPEQCGERWSNDFGAWCCTKARGHRGVHMAEV